MHFKTIRLTIFLYTTCLIKATKEESQENSLKPLTYENSNAIFNQIKSVKEILNEIETDAYKLHTAIDQQADIVYKTKDKISNLGINISQDAPLNFSKQLNDFYHDAKIKFLNLNEKTQVACKISDQLQWNKTQEIVQIHKSLQQCLLSSRSTVSSEIKVSNISTNLDKYILHFAVLKQKMIIMSEQEHAIEENSADLSKAIKEINEKLDDQSQYFNSLEKQLTLMDSASKTLDDYIIRKSNYYQRCRDGNCFNLKH